MIGAREVLRRLLRVVWLVRQRGFRAMFLRVGLTRSLEKESATLLKVTASLTDWKTVAADLNCQRLVYEISDRRRQMNEAFNNGDFARYFVLGESTGSLKDELASSQGLDPDSLRVIGSSFLGPLGHIAMLDIFLKGHQLGILKFQKLLVLAEDNRLPNPALMNQWSSQVDIQSIGPGQWRLIELMLGSVAETADFIRTRDGYQHSMFLWDRINHLWKEQERQPLLSLSDEHRDRGYEFLESEGIPRGSWFVVFHVREQARGESALGRNADINSFVSSMRAITDRGGVVVRTGDATMKRLPKMKNVFDYAHSPRRIDWLDVFFWAECRFFVGTASGPAHIPGVFGRPVLATNVSAPGIIFPYSVNSLMITKKFFRERDRQVVSIKEALSSGIGWNWKPGDSQLGISLVDNSAEEIESAVEDMLNGRNEESEKPSVAQQRFLEIRNTCGSKITTPIAPSFLQSAESLFW